MRDAGLISPDIMRDVLDEPVPQDKDTDILEAIGSREPVLASYVAQSLLAISGKLALSGAPPELVCGCHEDLLEVISASVRAVWRGYDEFWKGTDLEKMLKPARHRVNAPRPVAKGVRRAPQGSPSRRSRHRTAEEAE